MSAAEQIFARRGVATQPLYLRRRFQRRGGDNDRRQQRAAGDAATAASAVNGIAVETSPTSAASRHRPPTSVRLQNLQAQQSTANLAEIKSTGPLVELAAPQASVDAVESFASTVEMFKKPQVIYGFSAYDAATGECYLIELVANDQTVPDRLPNPTSNAT